MVFIAAPLIKEIDQIPVGSASGLRECCGEDFKILKG